MALHPGVISTNLSHHVREQYWWSTPIVYIGNLLLKTVEAGALNQLWAATAAKEDIQNGEMYWPVGDLIGGKRGLYLKDEELAKQLWTWTEEELKGQTI